MTSYGLLLYGPGSYAWYQCLDHFLPKPTVQNLMLKVLCFIYIYIWSNLRELAGIKDRWYLLSSLFLPHFWQVLLNQIVLGPCVIAVVFAWNNLWQRRLSELPEKYRRDALPTLLYGKYCCLIIMYHNLIMHTSHRLMLAFVSCLCRF